MAQPALTIRLRALRIIQSIRQFIARQSTERLFLIGALFLAVSLAFGLLIIILADVLIFNGFAANGAFQLMNPLRRLAAGEAIGSDFNFFHGIGVPLIHLPFYYLFGQGLLGSEIARWLVSPGLFVLTTFCFFYVFRRAWSFAVPMTVVVSAVAALLMPFLVLPLTSLLGVRSAVPVLLVALMLVQHRFKKPLFKNKKWLQRFTWYEFLVATILAISFICGTEFGVAAILAFFITHIVYRSDVRDTFKIRLLSAARIAGLWGAVLFALLTAITRGSPLEPLRFALSDIPVDQFWYFGVPPNNFLHLGNILQEFSTDARLVIMWAIALVATILVFRVHRLKTHRVHTQAFIFGLLAGAFAMISMLGYYHNSEASALARMALLVGSASAAILFSVWKKRFRFGFEIGSFKRRFNVGRAHIIRFGSFVFVILAITASITVIAVTKEEYDIKKVLARTKSLVFGTNTDILGPDWHGVASAVMPVIQADNIVPIADVTEGNYRHGVHTTKPEFVVEAGKHASFIRPGQIVYFVKSGRQIIKNVHTNGNRQIATLESPGVRLDPQHDGAPNKVIVAEDFDHDNTKVWSLYSGLLESEMHTFHPTHEGYDYIIHALGHERRAEYVNDFKQTKPEFVLTLSRPYFRYEEWVQNAHWDFYSLLNEHYEVAKETSIYLVWKKRDQQWHDVAKPQWQPLQVGEDQKIGIPNQSFETTPNIEAYGQELMRADRERLSALGKNVPEPHQLTADEYDARRIRDERAYRQYETMRRENTGLETDAQEHEDWLKMTREHTGVADTVKIDALHQERPKRKVILVKLEYEVSHPMQVVPLFGKTTRYFVEPNNVYSHTPVSLRPYASEITFPLVISEWNKDPYLRLNSYSILPGKGTIKIKNAEWAPVETSVANLKALTD